MNVIDHPREDRVVVFDGHCNLCDGFVVFVLKRDPAGIFSFASRQGDYAAPLLAEFSEADSILLVQGGRVRAQSDAVLAIAEQLPGPWHFVARVLRVIPRPLSDAVYRMVARHRYRLWGRRGVCRLPDPAFRSRFLDSM